MERKELKNRLKEIIVETLNDLPWKRLTLLGG